MDIKDINPSSAYHVSTVEPPLSGSHPWGPGGGGTPVHYLYGYVPPNGVVILKLLIQNGVSISEAFSISRANKEISFKKNRAISIYKLSRTEYKKLAHFQNGVSILGEIFFRTGCQFGVPGGTYPPKKYPCAPPPPGLGVLELGTLCTKGRLLTNCATSLSATQAK